MQFWPRRWITLSPSTFRQFGAKAAKARGLLGALTHEVPMEIDDRGYIVQLFAEALLVPVNEWDKVQSLWEVRDEPLPRNAAGKIVKTILTGQGGNAGIEE